MNKNCNECLIAISTAIALELVKGKTNEEIQDLRIIVGHIYSTISSYQSACLRHKS